MSNPETNSIFVARQPIFDRHQRVSGFELLFRNSAANQAEFSDSRNATSHVLSASYLEIGIQELTAGKPAFINFSRDLLLEGTPRMLPPRQVVIEILETVEPDEEVLRAVRDLKADGYRIALDDFSGDDRYRQLLPLVDILKVDLMATSPRRLAGLVESCRSLCGSTLTLLAEKVESTAQLSNARDQGFDLFQGYFFCKPQVLQSTRIPESKASHFKLLQTFQDPFLEFQRMEEIIKSDVALTAKLLKYINAAAFPWAGRIKSVKHALVLLGEGNIRKWITLVSLSEMARDKPWELAVASSYRGRFCEIAGRLVDQEHSELEHFLVGALSTMEAMLDVPMEIGLQQIPVSDEVKAALCGEPNVLGDLLDLTTSLERGNWNRLAASCQRLNLGATALPGLQRDALLWADRVLRN